MTTHLFLLHKNVLPCFTGFFSVSKRSKVRADELCLVTNVACGHFPHSWVLFQASGSLFSAWLFRTISICLKVTNRLISQAATKIRTWVTRKKIVTFQKAPLPPPPPDSHHGFFCLNLDHASRINYLELGCCCKLLQQYYWRATKAWRLCLLLF